MLESVLLRGSLATFSVTKQRQLTKQTPGQKCASVSEIDAASWQRQQRAAIFTITCTFELSAVDLKKTAHATEARCFILNSRNVIKHFKNSCYLLFLYKNIVTCTYGTIVLNTCIFETTFHEKYYLTYNPCELASEPLSQSIFQYWN